VSSVSVPPSGIASRAFDREVDQHLLELAVVGHDRPQVGGQRGLELHVLAKRPAQKLLHLQHHAGEVEHARAHGLAPREREQLVREPRRALAGLADLAHVALVVGALGCAAGDERRVAEDDGEQVVEVVRDPAGELAEALEPLRLLQLHLQALLLDHRVAERVQAAGERRDLGRAADRQRPRRALGGGRADLTAEPLERGSAMRRCTTNTAPRNSSSPATMIVSSRLFEPVRGGKRLRLVGAAVDTPIRAGDRRARPQP